LLDKVLRRPQALMEGVNDQLKNLSPLEPSRPRRATSGIVKMIAAVAAYPFPRKKPALDLFTKSDSPEQQLLLAAMTA
jgi:hypothetical protein